MSLDNVFKTFIEEAHELLEDMESALLNIHDGVVGCDAVNSIFRAAHTIKGSAGIFGLAPIVNFTHLVESVLDRVRESEIALDDELTHLMLLCKDHVRQQIDAISGEEVRQSAEAQSRESALVLRLEQYLPSKSSEKLCATDTQERGDAAHIIDSGRDQFLFAPAATNSWHISIRFGRDVLKAGMDPLSFIRYLESLGSIENIATLYSSIPSADHFDPEECYLGFEIKFFGDTSLEALTDVFEFVADDCTLSIIAPRSPLARYAQLLCEHVDGVEILKAAMLDTGTLTPQELDRITEYLSAARREEECAENAGALPELAESHKLSSPSDAPPKRGGSLRIESDKLDELINLIGELVIASSGVQSTAKEFNNERLNESALPLVRLVEEVRNSALNLRMVPIGDTFNRFQRVVRDVSRELNKEIQLSISGQETELDKTVVERIADPLTHLIRNAMDHGIESVEARKKSGKPPAGQIGLHAYHESGCIVIEVSDDGGGMDPDRILAKAYEKGLITHDVELTNQEIFQLIFEAGLSTAETVSNLSGRGVGMDVVKRNIENLRGSIEIESDLGIGTTIRIRLPLTLAIIDGFLMSVGESSFVVPLDIVEECFELERETIAAVEPLTKIVNLRGDPLPYLVLREYFREKGQKSKRQNIVVVRYGNQRAGIVVDKLVGEIQAVIKPMGGLFHNLKGISGSTILGDGTVALILDTPTLIQSAAFDSDPSSRLKSMQIAI